MLAAPAHDLDPTSNLRVPEAARRLGCSTRVLYGRIDTGEVHAVRDARGIVVVPAAEVDRLRDS